MTKKKTKPALTVKVSATGGSSHIYSDFEAIVCPLCRVTVPVGTEHRCETKG